MRPSKIWECKIGEIAADELPRGSDVPMREAVEAAYRKVTGRQATFAFTGWGGSLTEAERAVVEDREPDPALPTSGHAGWHAVARDMRDILRQVQDAVHEANLMPDLIRAEATYRQLAEAHQGWSDRQGATQVTTTPEAGA